MFPYGERVKKNLVAYLSLMELVLLIAGCVSFANPEQAPTSIPSPVAAMSVAPLTAPTARSDLLATLVPHGKPASEWNGIPIMSNALDGEGDEDSYRFTTAVTRQRIVTFYQEELPKVGWEQLGSQEGKEGAFIMIFSRIDSDTSVSISIYPKENIFIVLIAR